MNGLDHGYLVIFDRRPNPAAQGERTEIEGQGSLLLLALVGLAAVALPAARAARVDPMVSLRAD